MLAAGGKMIYSICSLNPMEDEAVVHQLLCETWDSMRLVVGRESVPDCLFIIAFAISLRVFEVIDKMKIFAFHGILVL
uniref:SAM-dependent MTase RsmB/NOP-type domain-containing protein n=1 Tax=Bracon brevicornis TaxID=1563983 RepID=A0A6V7J4U6_9HYME